MVPEYILILMIVIIDAEIRGPHHPRGGKVVKHHVHYKPSRGISEKITQDHDLLHDTEHLQEHLEEIIEEPDLSTLSDEELEFYYFQLHDTDRNSKLDGLEILQAILHTSDHSYVDDHKSVSEPNADFEYYVELIDRVLEEDDKDMDGYLSYVEYVAGRKGEDKNSQPVVNMIK